MPLWYVSVLDEDRQLKHRKKFLPFKKQPFPQTDLCSGKQTGSQKRCLPCKKSDWYISSPERETSILDMTPIKKWPYKENFPQSGFPLKIGRHIYSSTLTYFSLCVLLSFFLLRFSFCCWWFFHLSITVRLLFLFSGLCLTGTLLSFWSLWWRFFTRWFTAVNIQKNNTFYTLLIVVLKFNHTSTLVGHLVFISLKRQKTGRRLKKMWESKFQRRKRQNKSLPSIQHMLSAQQVLLTTAQVSRMLYHC